MCVEINYCSKSSNGYNHLLLPLTLTLLLLSGLWAMGSPLTQQRHLYAALNNCAFVSTENLHLEGTKVCFYTWYTAK